MCTNLGVDVNHSGQHEREGLATPSLGDPNLKAREELDVRRQFIRGGETRGRGKDCGE